ncbi:hypothetical protein K469DRAFT_595590, partial [Zopfia rhizophila CBS 207.26]
IPASTASDILKSKRPRRLQESDKLYTRGRPRRLTNSNANAFTTYIDQCEFEEKGDLWPELAYNAGRRFKGVSGIISHKAAGKEDHPPWLRVERVRWCRLQIEIRPHGKNWKCVIWCDEIHLSTSPRYVRNVKRKPGKVERFKPDNIQYKKDARPDPERRSRSFTSTV